jgi:integrase/recombinase XerD
MKTLRQAVGDYLALRRSLGFKLKDHERCLRELISFLRKKRSSCLSIRLALQLRRNTSTNSRRNGLLACV